MWNLATTQFIILPPIKTAIDKLAYKVIKGIQIESN